MGLWLCLSEAREAEFTALGLTPEYYGLGNAMRIVLPLFMTCDVLDLRPWPGLTNFTWRALYFYERYPRGLGFTERVFDALDEVMEAAARNVEELRLRRRLPALRGRPAAPVHGQQPGAGGRPDPEPPRRAAGSPSALREATPMEDLICEVYGPAEGRGILSGRAELLEQRRAEAATAPPRRLPSDAPAESAVEGRDAPAAPVRARRAPPHRAHEDQRGARGRAARSARRPSPPPSSRPPSPPPTPPPAEPTTTPPSWSACARPPRARGSARPSSRTGRPTWRPRPCAAGARNANGRKNNGGSRFLVHGSRSRAKAQSARSLAAVVFNQEPGTRNREPPFTP